MVTVDDQRDAPASFIVKTQLLCLWTVPTMGLFLLIAFLAFPGFFPPMSPTMSAQQVADFYREHASEIRFSMVTFNIFGIMLLPFYSVIVVQMQRMATPSKVLGYCYLTAATSGATVFAMADIMWLLAAFRPNRNPELVQLLNDMAWMIFVAPVGMIFVQNLCLAFAVFLDSSERPILPRWVAPFNLVIAAAVAPAAGASVVTRGPLAWNGAVSFWLRLVALSVYVTVMFFVLRKAVQQQASDAEESRAEYAP
ncbi:hypothetical protein [Mycobacterium conspicuum]|jgi:hypothetical protein|uniref:Uncharacterized protein n=1 Tax=Mycobacterium conspicuum TaxID=44010 RepID=A0A1X1TCM0_9MYCO|nr:hypothetical protein [Mycobacterium conspicuum]ORV42239.1 hypothetical protein AWC00_12060 [Mycobacterium conspicuum]BBZ39951.1 hypothetical protein MCNS_30140 [Mycobacterium conspicuum]